MKHEATPNLEEQACYSEWYVHKEIIPPLSPVNGHSNANQVDSAGDEEEKGSRPND